MYCGYSGCKERVGSRKCNHNTHQARTNQTPNTNTYENSSKSGNAGNNSSGIQENTYDGKTRKLDEYSPINSKYKGALIMRNVDNPRLLARAECLPIHNVQDTLNINRTQQLVTILAKPLAEIARNHLVNMNMAGEYMKQVKGMQNCTSNLQYQVTKKIIILEFRKRAKPRTVCKSPKCTIWQKRPNEWTPDHRICHDEGDTDTSPVPFSTKNWSYCMACGCHKKNHEHQLYQSETRVEEMVDKRAQYELEDVAQRAGNVKKVLEEEQQKDKQLELEHDLIRDFCAEAAVFLLKNSAEDPYLLQIQNMVTDEETKMKLGEVADMYYGLLAFLEQYKEKVKKVQEDIQEGRRSPVVACELMHKMDSLTLQPHSGEQVKRLRAICQDHIKELEQKENFTAHSNERGNIEYNAALICFLELVENFIVQYLRVRRITSDQVQLVVERLMKLKKISFTIHNMRSREFLNLDVKISSITSRNCSTRDGDEKRILDAMRNKKNVHLVDSQLTASSVWRIVNSIYENWTEETDVPDSVYIEYMENEHYINLDLAHEYAHLLPKDAVYFGCFMKQWQSEIFLGERTTRTIKRDIWIDKTEEYWRIIRIERGLDSILDIVDFHVKIARSWEQLVMMLLNLIEAYTLTMVLDSSSIYEHLIMVEPLEETRELINQIIYFLIQFVSYYIRDTGE